MICFLMFCKLGIKTNANPEYSQTWLCDYLNGPLYLINAIKMKGPALWPALSIFNSALSALVIPANAGTFPR